MAHAHLALAPCAAAVAVLGAALIAGCASAPGAAAPGASAPGTPQASGAGRVAAAAPGAFYDWHGLIPAPFGTLLKDMPIALTEVLMFHDSTASERANDEGDCYSPQGLSPPPFLGRRPDGYLLCFEHDHLSRIQASVSVPAADAPALLAAACRQWQHGAAGAADSAGGCTGRDGTTDFSARLGAGEPPPGDGATVDTAAVDTAAVDRAPMVLALTLHDHPP